MSLSTAASGGSGVRQQVAVVVGDLEGVLGELRAVVGDLKQLVSQIDQVTSRIDKQSSSATHVVVNSAGSRGVSAGGRGGERPKSLPTIPHAHLLSPSYPAHPATAMSLRSAPAAPWDYMVRSSTPQFSTPSCTSSLKITHSCEDQNNNRPPVAPARRPSSSTESTRPSEGGSSSRSSGSYSLRSSQDSLTFHYDHGYDPWQKLSLVGNSDLAKSAIPQQTKVIKKAKHKSGIRKSSMAYSVSPCQSPRKTCCGVHNASSSSLDSRVETRSSSCGGHGNNSSSSSCSASSEYCGVYEKALDERLELEFDDNLDIFETIENGIHGSAASDLADSVTYNRDINPWRQYSCLSLDNTMDDDLWSDYSDTCSSEDILNDNLHKDILNDNVVMVASSKRECARNGTRDYYWRTVIEP